MKERPTIGELEAMLAAPAQRIEIRPDGTIVAHDIPKQEWPDPTPEMLDSPEFEAVWQCIKTWDINVPGAYGGYCGATGNHVRAILDALRSVPKAA